MDFALPNELLEPFMQPNRKPVSKADRAVIKAKCHGRCAYCGTELNGVFHVDHIKAYYRGGKCEMDNYLPACPKCNNYKLTFTIEEFRELISRQFELAHRNSVNYRTALRFGLIVEVKKPIVFYFETLALQRQAHLSE